MNSSHSRSTRGQIGRRRRIVAIVIMIVLVTIVMGFGLKKVYASYKRWQKSRPVLCIEDSYGKRTDIHNRNQFVTVNGPARVWSPRFNLAIWEKKWEYPRFQDADRAVELKTQGGEYLIFLQPDVKNDAVSTATGVISVHLR